MERAYQRTLKTAKKDLSMKGVPFLMRALFRTILLLYAVLCCYVGMRSMRWLQTVVPEFRPALFWLAYLALHLSVIVSRGLRITWLSRVLTILSNVWMGFFLFLAAGILTGDLIDLVGSLAGFSMPTLRQGGAAVLGVTLVTVSLAMVQAYRIHITEYEIAVDKPCAGRQQLSVAVFSDLHLGKTIGIERVREVVERVNNMDADLILLVGDMFDNDMAGIRDFEETAALLGTMKSTYGTYACLGNHDVDLRANFEVDDIGRFYDLAGVRLLRDEAVELDGFTLIGRLDYRPIGSDQKRKSIGDLLRGVDMAKPVLVMDHQPEDIIAEAQHGVDLTVCGHTHGGQLFPGSLVTGRMFANDYGHLDIDGAHSIVSSGIGFWGPPMRTASRSEIVHILVNFSQQ